MSRYSGCRSEDGVTLDRVSEALSHSTRRRILMAIRERTPQTGDAFESAEFIPEDGNPDRTAILLHHRHLPHLDGAGFIDWGRETDTITKGPHFEEIDPLLKVLDDNRTQLPDGQLYPATRDYDGSQ